MERPSGGHAPLPRSYLVVPAIRFDRFMGHLLAREAPASWPDALIFDLEDSVPDERKEQARADLAAALPDLATKIGAQVRLLVKINGTPTRYYQGDLALVRGLAAFGIGIALAKTETVSDLEECFAAAGDPRVVPILPAIETVVGFYEREALFARCAAAGVTQFAFGAGDMSSEFGVERDYGLDLLRQIVVSLVISCRRHRIGLVDSPCRAIPKTRAGAPWDTLVHEECTWDLRNGVSGKIAIHPAQVPIIHTVFGNAGHVAWAREVVADFARMPDRRSVVSSADGRYMGTPTLKWARRILEQSQALAQTSAQAPGEDP